MILLGWEIGSGRRVEIPETGHLAWFGQTQLSGKTTALEAIAFRGELKAVAFITKQGEGGFLTGRMIPPYFSEPTNDEEQPLWRWVKSILEAGQQRRMNFEESWIIRACEDPRQAQTLADVHTNIKSLLGGEGDYIEKGRGKKKKQEWKYSRKPVSGINAGVYTSLKAYFDIVMPQLARLPYTKKLVLGPGLNVMDLREYAMETQALVIRSVMEWVYQHEKGVRVIVPEAQDFVPQGKNSPVKMACETLVRKAGANKNFMWLDSQDMAAVDKIMLRACSIVGVGVQTEGHEIDRSLASLFTPALKPIDIARLKIGEFFVRTPEAKVSKVYVQPAWMESELHAQAIAKGEESVATARQMLRAFKSARNKLSDSIKSDLPPESWQAQPGDYGWGIDPKTKEWREGEPPQLLQVQTQEPPDVEKTEPVREAAAETAESDERTDRDATARITDRPLGSEIDRVTVVRSDHDAPREQESESEGAMPQTKQTPFEIVKQYFVDFPEPAVNPHGLGSTIFLIALRDLLKDHAALIESHDALAKEVNRLRTVITARGMVTAATVEESGAHHTSNSIESGNGLSLTVPQLEYIYKFVKARGEKDPGVLEILTRKPELRFKVERQTVVMEDTSLIGRITKLLYEGWFKQPKNGPAVQKELKRRGCEQPTTNLYKPLNKLTEMGFLTLESDGYQEVSEMKTLVQKA